MENLVYALIAVMVVDAGLLVFFVVRTILKSKAEKDADKGNKNKKGASTLKNTAKNSANETAKSAQKTVKLAHKSPEKDEKPKKIENTKKAKQKLTKRSSYGKIKVNEQALKKILAGYDEKDNAGDAEKMREKADVDQSQPLKEENLDAVFEDFKVEEPATKVEPKFSSPFRRANGRRTFIPKPPKEEDDYDDFGDDDDFEDDIEKAYQDFLTRKKQEYLKKYESNFDDETDDKMNDNIGEINDETDDELDFDEEEFSNSPFGKQPKFNELQDNKKPKGASQAYTIEDFKDDYFNKKEDISLILSKLSEVDKNKILSILLSKESIDESDFD